MFSMLFTPPPFTMHRGIYCCIATPRSLPSAHKLLGNVAIVDLAFASNRPTKSYPSITHRLIDHLGHRLVAFIDHHDSLYHADFKTDPRFILSTKAEHGACPEMITPDFVKSCRSIDTIVCHNDFDGLASAAKWMNQGHEPYSGCDYDAWCIDTRLADPSPRAHLIDQALRSDPKDLYLRHQVIDLFLNQLESDELWDPIKQAAKKTQELEIQAVYVAQQYESLSPELVFVDGTSSPPFDKTHALLLGQKQSLISAVKIKESITFAAPFNSGVNLVDLFGLSGGMPTVVSISLDDLESALWSLNVEEDVIDHILDRYDQGF
jgi:hypothetical protein